MKTPYCLVCRENYNLTDRTPFLLHCAHTFCHVCISHLLSSSHTCSVSCPRCRHVSLIGNHVSALKKNYAILVMLQAQNDETDHDNNNSNIDYNNNKFVIECKELKVMDRIGEGNVWGAILSKCRHRVVVKEVGVDGELVRGRLEEVWRKSMWCRNVCCFRGVCVMDSGKVCVVMDRCDGTMMETNGGRLTLEQILRLIMCLFMLCVVYL